MAADALVYAGTSWCGGKPRVRPFNNHPPHQTGSNDGRPDHLRLLARSAASDSANIEEQLWICRSVAAERGYVADERYVFINDGVGGLGTPGPAWKSLVDLTASDPLAFGAVVVRDANRISRSQQVGEEWLARLRDAGAKSSSGDSGSRKDRHQPRGASHAAVRMWDAPVHHGCLAESRS